MKTSQIITRLLQEFPKNSESVSKINAISSVEVQAANGGQMVIQTAEPHGLAQYQGIYTQGIVTPISIVTIVHDSDADTLQIVTSQDHDLTFTEGATLTIQNCSVATFNGTHLLKDVSNRRTATVTFVGTGVNATDGELIHAERYSQSWNGLWQVGSIQTPTQFTVLAPIAIIGNSAIGGVVHSNIAISGSVTYEVAKAAFTKQSRDKGFLVVVLNNTIASKSRFNNSDLTAVIGRGSFYRQQNQQLISIYYMSNPNDEISMRLTRDNMEDVAYALDKCLLFHEFTNATTFGKSHPMVFVEHGTREYDGSFYSHEFVFESDEELNFGDTSGYSNDVALRNINAYLDPNLSDSVITEGTVTADAAINLDEVPL
tara:strand:+ start:16 stop:1131 length:1116 start_codon:yes stop_codon:yes gene_type:complete